MNTLGGYLWFGSLQVHRAVNGLTSVTVVAVVEGHASVVGTPGMAL